MIVTQNKTILFSTGKLIIDDKKISFHLNKGNVNNVNTIARENIGHVDKQPMRLLPKSEFVHCFQTVAIGIGVSIVGLILAFSTNFYFLFYIGLVIISIGLFLFFSHMWLDGLLGLNIAKPIIRSIYGVDAVRVVVQNTYGGNNLRFLVRLDEKSKIPKLEDYKLDKTYNVENVQINSTNNSIDDIEKLLILRDKGIITHEEFDLKKKQILGI